MIELLGDTEAGRHFELGRFASLDDFRASVPLMDARTHAEQVSARLGFSQAEGDDAQLCAPELEREANCAVWRQRLGAARPRRVALLMATADDLLLDRTRHGDLRALAGAGLETLRITQLPHEPSALLSRLRSFGPDTLIVPSLGTCAWIEAALHTPLERGLPSLRRIFAHHDLGEHVRSRLPILNSGILHGAGRVGIPSRRSPWQGFTLATRSTLIELLPHRAPQLEARRDPLPQTTVLPERAILGQRYELVLSGAAGFLRLRSGLHVRVVGFAPPTLSDPGESLPRPRVVSLAPPPQDAKLEGLTLPGSWLTATVRQSFLAEDPALVSADITADPEAIHPDSRASRSGLDPFTDTELGASRAGLRRQGPRARALVIRLEVHGQAHAQLARRMAARADLELQRRSEAYAWLRAREDLWEPRVFIARPGTARREREEQLRALSGPVARPVARSL